MGGADEIAELRAGILVDASCSSVGTLGRAT